VILRKPARPAAGLRVYAVPFRAEPVDGGMGRVAFAFMLSNSQRSAVGRLAKELGLLGFRLAEVVARVQVVDADQWDGYARRHFGQYEGDMPTAAELAAPDAHHRLWLTDWVGVHR
jgi:hypothetical protein